MLYGSTSIAALLCASVLSKVVGSTSFVNLGFEFSILTRSSSSKHLLTRSFGTESVPERKVAVLGAAGGIGQPLALLMKLNPLVSQLALYDIAGTPGVAADVGHVNTRSEVTGYVGEDQLDACLKGLNGVPDVVECSFVQSTVTELPFFASKVKLGKNGVESVLGLGHLSDFEKEGLEKLKPELKASIEKGIQFANKS
ncbi:Malate dehydrogenase, mitochondrial, partial [Cucurbita argyrosperma subsp. sororia]